MENMEELKTNLTPSVDAESKMEGQMGMVSSSTQDIGNNQGDDTSPLLLGKFKDVEALEKAYISLQSDYTKKCQLLSQVDKASPSTLDHSQDEQNTDVSEKVDFSSLSKEDKENILQEYIFSSPDLKDKFVAKYFDELSLPHSPRLIASDRGSRMVTAPKSKPRTLKEAGQMAEEVLNDNTNRP